MEHDRTDYLRDFSTDARVLFLVGLALVIGAAGAGAAAVLLWLIGLITNLAYSGQHHLPCIHGTGLTPQ